MGTKSEAWSARRKEAVVSASRLRHIASSVALVAAALTASAPAAAELAGHSHLRGDPSSQPPTEAPTVESFAIPAPRSSVDEAAMTFVAQRHVGTPFSMIGASWDRGHEQGAPRIRVEHDGWSEWLGLEPATDGPDLSSGEGRLGAIVSEPVWVAGADAFEIEASTDAVGLRVHVVRAGEDQAGTLSPIYLPGGAPPIYARASWGARPSRAAPTYASRVKMAFIHHTVNTNTYAASDVPAMLRSIQAYHQDAQGWADIGYNVLVDRFGRVWEGRAGGTDRAVVGAHTQGFNTGSVGVAVIGTFSSSPPTAAALDAVGQVVGWKLGVGGVSPHATTTMVSGGNDRYPPGAVATFNTVSGHLDAKPTSCPGGQLYSRLPAIRDRADVTAGIVAASPFGHVDIWRQEPQGFRIVGWTADSSAPTSPRPAHLYVDGVFADAFMADSARPDVAEAYPELGPNHGYDVTVPFTAGTHQVCLYAINTGAGRNSQLGCETILIHADPIGRIDQVRVVPDGVHLLGWGLDFDTTAAVQIVVLVDGVRHTFAASSPRPDVGDRYPPYGAGHGFDVVVPAPATSLCVELVNIGPGANSSVGCPSVDSNPFGHVDSLSGRRGEVQIAGWAIDPNTADPVVIHVYSETGYLGGGTAAIERRDVEARHPGYGSRHGFDLTISAPAGQHQICVYALNRGVGATTRLGCRTLTIG